MLFVTSYESVEVESPLRNMDFQMPSSSAPAAQVSSNTQCCMHCTLRLDAIYLVPTVI